MCIASWNRPFVILFFLQNFQTGPAPHPASYFLGTETSLSCFEVYRVWSWPPTTISFLWEEQVELCLHCVYIFIAFKAITRLMPNDPYMGRTAPLTSKRCILYTYSTNIGTEYFKHALYSPFFSLQNAVCFVMLTCLVPVLFTFYIQGVLKFKKIIPAPKGYITFTFSFTEK